MRKVNEATSILDVVNRFFCSSVAFSIIFLLLSYVACDTPILFAISKEEQYVLEELTETLVILYRFPSREVDRFLASGPNCGLGESTNPSLTLFPGSNNVSSFFLLLNGHMWNWGPIYSARANIHY